MKNPAGPAAASNADRRLLARAGTGIIFVIHNLHDSIPEITRVILMKDGTFVHDGAKSDIITGENIGSLFNVPLSIKEEDG